MKRVEPGVRRAAQAAEPRQVVAFRRWLHVAAVDARIGSFYPLYREPGAHEMLFQR